MKRLVLALALLAVSAGSAVAEQIDEYRDALEAFLGGYSSPNEFIRFYADKVIAGIDGTWVEINLLDGRTDPSAPTPMSQPEFERMCGIAQAQIKMERTSPLSFTMTRFAQTDMPLTYTFQAMTGAQFAFSAPADLVISRLGFDIDKVFDQDMIPWYSFMPGAGGIATIFAPSPNIRVMIVNQVNPSIFARCSDPQ